MRFVSICLAILVSLALHIDATATTVTLNVPHNSVLFSIEHYGDLMIESVVNNDAKTGIIAEIRRDELITIYNLDIPQIPYYDLLWLSKIMDIEAGGCEEKFYWGVGEVVLNRVASPEFPNSITSVLNSPNQYYGRNSKKLLNHQPRLEVVKAAWRLLSGERHLNRMVVFHSRYTLGGGAYTKYHHDLCGDFVLSVTAYPELYL